MASNGNFSVGNDVTLTIVGGPDGPLTFTLITSFESRQETTSLKVIGLDGVTRYDELPHGWRGSFELERSSSALEDYFASAEARYFAGGGTYNATVTETIGEPAGGISQFRYEGVALKLDNAGTWKGDASVKQKVSFSASRRRKVV